MNIRGIESTFSHLHYMEILMALLFGSLVAVVVAIGGGGSGVLAPESLKAVGITKKSLAEHSFTKQELTGTPVCGDSPPAVANATWVYSERDGSQLTYTCDIGFRTSTGAVSFEYACANSNSTLEACYMVQCTKPPAIANGKLEWPWSASLGNFGTSVDYICDKGYSGDGEARGPHAVKLQCMDNGEYEFVLPTVTGCHIIHCSPPLDIPYGTLLNEQDPFSTVLYNNTIQYQCMSGFKVSTNPSVSNFTLTCGDQGEYIPNEPLPLCVPAQCPLPPPAIPNAQAAYASGSISVNSRIVYRCDEGFVLSDNPSASTFNVRCEYLRNSAQYVVPKSFCQSSPCLPVPPLENAVVASTKTDWRYRDIVPFECIEGYTLGGVKGQSEFSGQCSMQGVWTIGNQPGCAPVQCAINPDEIDPDLTDFGRLVPFRKYPVEYQSSSTVECEPGAVVTGTGGKSNSVTITCGPDGEFVTDGVCAYPCGVIPKVPFSTSTSFGAPIEFGEPGATITCKPGFHTPSGLVVQTVRCNRDGSLSKIEPCIQDTEGGEGDRGPDWAYQPRIRDILQNGLLASEHRKSSSSVVVVALVPLLVTFLLA
jgi:hypothetical protein